MFDIMDLEGYQIGRVEDSEYDFYRDLLNDLKNVELRLICNISRIKRLPSNADDIRDQFEEIAENFKTLPPAQVNTVLMFKIDGMIVHTGNWVFNQGLSDRLQKLVFSMTKAAGKIDYIGIDPVEIQKVQVRSICINPFPDLRGNSPTYGTIIKTRPQRGASVVLGGRAWEDRPNLAQFISAYVVDVKKFVKEDPDE